MGHDTTQQTLQPGVHVPATADDAQGHAAALDQGQAKKASVVSTAFIPDAAAVATKAAHSTLSVASSQPAVTSVTSSAQCLLGLSSSSSSSATTFAWLEQQTRAATAATAAASSVMQGSASAPISPNTPQYFSPRILSPSHRACSVPGQVSTAQCVIHFCYAAVSYVVSEKLYWRGVEG